MREYTLFTEFEKADDSVMRDVLYNVLIEYGVPIKLIRINKMCLNDTFLLKSLQVNKYYVSYSKWSKTRRCFNAIVFQPLFGTCH
jgi:hypothetical protein